MSTLTKTINLSDEDFFEDEEGSVQDDVSLKQGGDETLSVASTEEKSDDENDKISGGKNIVLQLSQDPLYIVLCQFLKSKTGKNLTDVLEDIKDNITELNEKLEKLTSKAE